MKTKTFGKWMQRARIKAGLTQSTVAEALGYSSGQYVSNWEREFSLPPAEKLPRISLMYKIPKKELVTRLELIAAQKYAAKLKAALG